MDYTKYPFGTEGCSSSESGWTMYIDPPMQEDDMECYNEEDDNNDHKSNYNYGKHGGYNKDDSDDSMASDASSGPSHQHKRANAESSHTMASSKNGKSGQFKKLFSWKKSNEKEKKSVEHSSKQKHKNDSHNHKKYFK